MSERRAWVATSAKDGGQYVVVVLGGSGIAHDVPSAVRVAHLIKELQPHRADFADEILAACERCGE